jgi:hypothetical protein
MMLAAMPKTPKSARHGGAFETSPFRGFGEVSIAPLKPKSPAFPPDRRNGTALAINYITSGVAAHLPSSTGRGGARNRADRECHALKPAQIANLRAAVSHADKIGLPFTRMITIHWEAAGVHLAAMAKATGRFLDLLTRWLARNGQRTAWLWVHENGEGKGGHCHLLVHVPPAHVKSLAGAQKRWLRTITGQPYRPRVIHSKPIGGRLGLETGNADLHAINLEAALAYVLKGTSEAVAARLALQRQEPGGRVIGKRCGTSQNIGVKARNVKEST